MEKITDILSDKDIEGAKENIESIIFQYVGLLPDSDIIESIDESLFGYSAENKKIVLKDIVFYQNKIKENAIFEYLYDRSHIKHVDELKYKLEHFDYDNANLYYDATSKAEMPFYRLLEELQFHQILNKDFDVAQKTYNQQLHFILNEYMIKEECISKQNEEEIRFVFEQYESVLDSIYEKYENELNPIYEKYEKEYVTISTYSDEIFNSFFERRENELEPIYSRRKNELNSIFGQYDEKVFSINLQYDEKRNAVIEKKEKALNSLFEQYELVLKPILEQSNKGCDSFVKSREKERNLVTMLDEKRAELEPGFQPENKRQSEENDQFFDSILENMNRFLQEETMAVMTYSGTWTSETCVFKGGVGTCTEKSGQF